ncbi:MAG: hypothetical protein NTZ56_14425 [Acidobacteria bacterium]|nr:hypothetical protein [Acidobacteriota bacterium]
MNQAHAAIFRPPPSNELGRLTDRVASPLPPATTAGPIARRNFVDQHIFAKLAAEKVSPAP